MDFASLRSLLSFSALRLKEKKKRREISLTQHDNLFFSGGRKVPQSAGRNGNSKGGVDAFNKEGAFLNKIQRDKKPLSHKGGKKKKHWKKSRGNGEGASTLPLLAFVADLGKGGVETFWA